jgi:hypothetical protein
MTYVKPVMTGTSTPGQNKSYLLRKGRNYCPLRRTQLRFRPLAFFRNSRSQPLLDEAKYSSMLPARRALGLIIVGRRMVPNRRAQIVYSC